MMTICYQFCKNNAYFSFLGLVASFLLLHTNTVQAQEQEELPYAVQAPHDSGVYRGINQLPEELRRSAPFARSFYELERRVGKGSTFDMKTREEAFRESQQHLIRDAKAAMKSSAGQEPFATAWTNIGPKTWGGNTTAFAIDPKNTNILYAGAVGGGVWKSTNQGGSWTPLTDEVIPGLAVASIAIDPNNTNVIYVGSGTGYPSLDEINGTGLYKSTNAGLSWQRIAETTLDGTIIKVLVNPNNSNIVFASTYNTSKGLYRSTNAGATWTKVFPTSSFAQGVVWDIVPGHVAGGAQILYFIEGNNVFANSQECGVYKSVNDGATWTKITTGGVPRGDSIGRAAIACSPASPQTVYTFMALPDGNFKGLYRSTNGGTSFSKINTVPSTIFRPDASFSPQGWYDITLAVDPKSTSNRAIIVGGVEAYVSRNDGQTWSQFSGYTDVSTVHVDHHSVAFDPKNQDIIYVGTDGGIFQSLDRGVNWDPLNDGYITTQYYHLALDKSDNSITWSGAQDNGTWLVINNSNPAERIQLGGDGFQPLVSHTNHNVVYGELPMGQLFKASDALQQFGASFSPIGSFDDDAYWDAPFRMAPFNANTLYQGRTKVWRTTNGGVGWTAISTRLVQGDYIKALGLSAANANYVWAGYSAGKIFLTTNAGGAWSSKPANSNGADITYIVTHPTNAGFALASFAATSANQPRVMLTTDQGSTWKDVSGAGKTGLPAVAVNGIAIDSVNPSTRWYAATDNGIYYTLNAGSTWSIAGSGLGLAQCRDIQIHPNKTTIRVATFGRGIWQANANVLPVELEGLAAIATPQGTRLNWKTDSERNNYGFYVLRSYNFGPFEEIHFTPGAGNSNNPNYYEFLDTMRTPGTYLFQLRQVDLNGTEHFSNSVEIRYGRQEFTLGQNYPNPFAVSGDHRSVNTLIRYSVPEAGQVSMKIFSVDGKLIRTLLDNHQADAGNNNTEWDGRDAAGHYVASGVYYYTLQLASGEQIWKKMIVLE